MLPPEGLDAGAGAEYPFGLSLAADGRSLVYPAAKAGVVTLWLHDLRTGEARALPGTDGAAMPFWTADQSKIGFFTPGHLRALDLATGQSSELAEATSGRGAAWNAPGDIVFAPSAAGALMHRDAAGKVGAFTTLEAGESSHTWPAFLPDGRHVIFLVTGSQSSRSGIWIAALDDPADKRKLFDADAQAVVSLPESVPGPTSQAPSPVTILYLRDLALMAQRLDPASLEPSGRAEVVGLNAGRGPLGQIFATASSDVLIYGAARTSLRELKWLTRAGQPSGPTSEPIDAWDLRIAPDGRRFAVTEVDRQLRTLEVFIRTAAQPAPTRLSLSTDADESGVWSPDGLRVAWAGQRRKVMLRGAGAVLPEQTIATFDTPVQVWDWSHDGRALLIGRRNHDTGDDLWIQPPTEGASATAYAIAPFDQAYGVFSPDGRTIAYASNESGQFDVYVDSFPKSGTRIRVTTAGGTEPRWSADGRELFFRRGSEIYAAALSGSEVQSIMRLFDAGAPIRSYDVSRDGRFLINVPADDSRSASATIVHNWDKPAQ